MENKYFIDTNVIIRFLLFDEKNPELSKLAKKIFSRASKGKIHLFINDIVVSEVCYVLEGVYKISKIKIAESISDILNLQNISVENDNIIYTSLEIYSRNNCDFEDAYLYTNMLASGCNKIFSFDKKHFNRFKGIEVLP